MNSVLSVRLAHPPPQISSQTSNVGTIGELHIIARLIGYEVFQDVTGASAIDLIAYKDGQYKRIQVKTRRAKTVLFVFLFTEEDEKLKNV